MSIYGVKIDSHAQNVSLKSKRGRRYISMGLKEARNTVEGEKVYFYGSKGSKKYRRISFIAVKKVLRLQCEGHLRCVTEEKKVELVIEDTPIINEFPNISPEEIPGLLPKREIDCEIS